MQDFRKVEAWAKTHRLVLGLYRETQQLPREEGHGLTMQLRRSSTAVATRIAEGCGRDSSVEYASDLRKAISSCNEVEYGLLLARDLGYFGEDGAAEFTNSVVEVREMTFGLLRKL